MKLFKITTFASVALFAAVNTFSLMGFTAPATGTSKISLEKLLSEAERFGAPTDFANRLNVVLGDKNGASLKGSTAGKGSAKKSSLRKDTLVAGGSSDGGGNFVEGTLFDFYENQGAIDLSDQGNGVSAIENLLMLEPLAIKVLVRLNTLIPAMDYTTTGGLGDVLKNSVSRKKIYLESKPLVSSGCVNESMVETEGQRIAACQSNLEIRFSIPVLMGNPPRNAEEAAKRTASRAGLFVHELVLGWARSLKLDDSKKELEEKVRETVRLFFQRDLTSKMVQTHLKNHFKVDSMTPEKFQKIQAIAAKIKILEPQLAEMTNESPRSINDLRAIFANAQVRGHFLECGFYVESFPRFLSPAMYQKLKEAELSEKTQLCVEDENSI